MTGSEIFKLDVRIRERMLRKGSLSEAEVNKHLDALPDVASQGEDMVLRQPAVQRFDDAAAMRAKNPAPRSVPPPVAAPTNVDEASDGLDDDDWGESP